MFCGDRAKTVNSSSGRDCVGSMRTETKMPNPFPYDLAFDRNLGLVTEWEQLALRAKRVAIVGMGGVGGAHLTTLARLGIGAFTIADYDHFEFANFNRQAGALVQTVGRAKVEVLEEMALAINPEIRIRRFDDAIDPANIDQFLADADLFVDGIDFFAIDIRRRLFARAAELGIPAITAAPIGMGAALLVFMPGHMTFEQYFRLEGYPQTEQYLRFLIGLTPNGLQRGYVVDPTRIDLAHRKGPSTVAACQLCAGVTAVAAVKLLLGRGNIKPAPCNHQFDPYRGRFSISRLAFGNAGPLQRLKIAVGRRLYGKLASGPVAEESPATARSPIEEILNLARWAPSGDNGQPWTFEIVAPETVRVHIRTDPANVYEYRDCEPTWLSAGMLLETMRIAATGWQRTMTWEAPNPGTNAILVRFVQDDRVSRDRLFGTLTVRSVDRHAYRWRGLTDTEKAALTACLGNSLGVQWHESLRERWQLARMGALATTIRFRTPEAFAVHQQILDWVRPLSPGGIPVGTLPLDPVTVRVMHWAMQSWGRAKFLGRLGATSLSAVQMDYAPILASAALFDIRLLAATAMSEDRRARLLDAGGRLQRFWLTATRLGLAMQPLLAIICMAHYGATRTPFTREPGLAARSEQLMRQFERAIGAAPAEIVFLGRIGEPVPRLPVHRSVRRAIVLAT